MAASRTSPRRPSAVLAALAFCLVLAPALYAWPPKVGTTRAREGDEDKYVDVWISLEQALSFPITVRVFSRPITARPTADYDTVDVTLSFAPGVRSQRFQLKIRGDDFVEPDETLALHLDDGSRSVFTIEDDDEPNSFPNLVIDNAEVFEGAAPAQLMRFRVTLSEPPPFGARVDYETASSSATAGLDFEPVSGTLLFEPGQVLHWIEVPILDDADFEEYGEFLYVDLTNAVGANLQKRWASGAIRDDDGVSARYLFARGATGIEGGTAVFRLELSQPSSTAISLRWSAAEPEVGIVPKEGVRGRDYAGLLERITFLPGETVKEIAVPLFDDNEQEGDEYFALWFEPVVQGLGERAFPALGVIIDDDKPFAAPQLEVHDLRVVESDTWNDVQFTLSLARAAQAEARVTVELREDTALVLSDFVPATTEVVFAPGETVKSVRLRISGDTTSEPLEHFTLHFRSPRSLTLVRDEATVTIIDDDGATRPRAVRPR